MKLPPHNLCFLQLDRNDFDPQLFHVELVVKVKEIRVINVSPLGFLGQHLNFSTCQRLERHSQLLVLHAHGLGDGCVRHLLSVVEEKKNRCLIQRDQQLLVRARPPALSSSFVSLHHTQGTYNKLDGPLTWATSLFVPSGSSVRASCAMTSAGPGVY